MNGKITIQAYIVNLHVNKGNIPKYLWKISRRRYRIIPLEEKDYSYHNKVKFLTNKNRDQLNEILLIFLISHRAHYAEPVYDNFRRHSDLNHDTSDLQLDVLSTTPANFLYEVYFSNH